MGIDQVAQVGDIVGKAVAQRAGKIGKHPTVQHPTVQHRREKSPRGWLNWKRTDAASEHEKSECLRGTEKFGKTKTVVAAPRQSAAIPTVEGNIGGALPRRRYDPCRRHPAPGFHPRFRHAALPPDAETFCLLQNRRGLQPSVQLLHHSPDARLAPQPRAGGHRRRGEGAHRRRREGNQSDFAGLDLLRPRFAPGPWWHRHLVCEFRQRSDTPETHRRDACATTASSRAISSPEKFSATVKALPPMPRPFARCCAN